MTFERSELPSTLEEVALIILSVAAMALFDRVSMTRSDDCSEASKDEQDAAPQYGKDMRELKTTT
jgi:hypothetical protein